MSARRSISWNAAVVDLKNDRSNVVHYRQKWVLSRSAWLAYKPARSGPPTDLLGIIQMPRGEIIANVVGGFGILHEVGRFPQDQAGLRAAKVAIEDAIAMGEAA